MKLGGNAMIQMTLIQIDNYGPWTVTPRPRTESDLQMLQASLFADLNNHFGNKKGPSGNSSLPPGHFSKPGGSQAAGFAYLYFTAVPYTTTSAAPCIMDAEP